MARHRPILIVGLSLTLLVTGAHVASALTFTCSTVARSPLFDPEGAQFKSKFQYPAINASGDTVFVGNTRDRLTKLYLYPGAGAASVIARKGDPAAVANSFRKFEQPSINDTGDVGFFGDLASGEGVFVKPFVGAIAAAATTGQASPSGGAFLRFHDVSDVNASGDIAFVAQVTGGPNGVFVWDGTSMTVSAVATVGQSTGSGRQFCSFVNVGLGSSRVAFQAVTETTCGVSNDALFGVFQDALLGFTTVAQEGDPGPIVGSTFVKFYDTDSNGSNDVGYRAKLTGTVSATAVLLYDPVATTTTLLSRTGDSAPVSGGSIKTLPQIGGITDNDRVAYRGKISNGAAKHGVFIFDGPDDKVVLNTDTVPNDLWGTTAAYKNIDEDTGVSSTGTRAAFISKVKDKQTPSGTGVFRCTGS